VVLRKGSLFACKITTANYSHARLLRKKKRYRIFSRGMSRIFRIAAEQVIRVMNMQKTVNFDAARYFRFLFPSLLRSMYVSVSIFSRCERGQNEYLTGAWSDLSGCDLFFFFYSTRKWKRTLDETKLKHFSSITRVGGRQWEFQREDGNEGVNSVGVSYPAVEKQSTPRCH